MVESVFLSAVPSIVRVYVADSVITFETEELELQNLSGPAPVNATLWTEIWLLNGSIEAFVWERRKVGKTAQDVCDLMASSKKIQAKSESLKKQNPELVSKVRVKTSTLQWILLG